MNLLIVQNHYIDEGRDEDEADDDDDDDNDIQVRYHYLWIKNLSALAKSSLSKHKNKLHVCDRCLHFFIRKINF